MSLASAPPVFAYYTSNHASTPTQLPGTNFTAGANDTDGAAVSCISALTHDAHRVSISLAFLSASGVDTNSVGDLLIDPAGGTSWSVLISDLACGFTAANGTMPSQRYDFPLWVPAGASLGWRCKSVRTSGDTTTPYVLVEAYGEPSRPEMWWCGQGVETLGVSDSKGTPVTPGNSGSWGSWTSIGSTTAHHIKAVQLGINGPDATANLAFYHFQIGAGSQPIPGSATVWCQFNTSELGYRLTPGIMYCNLAAGTQLQTRATCSTTAEDIYCGMYGVY